MRCFPVALLALVLACLPASTASAAFAPDATVARSPDTGTVRFVGLPRGSADPGPAATRAATTAAAAGRAYLEGNATAFGLDASSVRTLRSEAIAGGETAVRYQQEIDGVEVLGGQFVVQLTPGRRVRSVMGEAVPDAGVDTTPGLSAAAARDAAVGSVAKGRGVDAGTLTARTPSLAIFDSRVMGGPGLERPQLVWSVVVSDDDGTIADRVLVEADRGFVVATLPLIHEAKTRTVCDANNLAAKVPCTSADVVRSEGQAPVGGAGATDVNNAYDFAGATYDFYAAKFGRDSIDGAGLPLRSTVRYCDPDEACPYQNAFWSGAQKQMVYGQGFANADDVVAHELTHGVTDYESGLYYYFQSGAINESLSDVFGELIDQASPDAGTRWQLGEDIAGGAIRDMKNPPAFGDPDRMGSGNYTDAEGDSGGVHTNSGVNNKATYLMTDGDTFNGQTIAPLGQDKVARIYYRVQTAYLTSASSYLDLGTALPQACSDLVGTAGITAADCGEVGKVVAATEMTTNTRGLVQTPTCDPGVPSRAWYAEDFATADALTRWVPAGIVGPARWYPGNATPYGDYTYSAGDLQVYGDDIDVQSDTTLEQAAPVAIRPGARLVFRHAYGFEDSDPNGTSKYDGGVVEYDAGAGWQALPGVPYPTGGVITTQAVPANQKNPLEGRPAFVGESKGYITTVTPLDTLVGQQVRFRFRIGTDGTGYAEGWHIDDVSVRICDADPPETTIDSGPAEGATVPSGSAPAFAFVSDEQDVTFECQVDGGAFASCPAAYQAPALPAGAHRITVRARDFVGNVDASPAVRSFTVAAPPAPAPVPPGPPGGVAPPRVLPPAVKSAIAIGRPKRSGNRVVFTLTAPSAGAFTITGKAKNGRRSVSVGTGTARATKAGKVTLRLTIGRAARRALRSRSLTATFTGTFRPASGAPVALAPATLKLARQR